MAEKTEVKAKYYTLYDDKGVWLGQIVLTDDGMFASVTAWGNLSFSWPGQYSEKVDFRKFICSLHPDYFGGKMFTGMSYMVYAGRDKAHKACHRFAEKILPPLQKALRKELDNKIPW